MRKIIFTKNILGNDPDLFAFISRRFDVLVAAISGTQAHNIGRIVEWTHQVNSKLYVRSQFIHNTPLDMIVEKTEKMLASGIDGLVFQGQTTEEKADDLMLVFRNVAHELAARNVQVPVVFMVDWKAGQIDLVAELKKLITRDEFPGNIDLRTAVRIASQEIKADTRFPGADLVIVDFSPFDTHAQYEVVNQAAAGNSLDVIAYMTYDNLSNDLKQAIQNGYGIPSEENNKKNVVALHDLTLREAPSGQIIKRADGRPLVVKSGLRCVVLEIKARGDDIWYQVETVFGISGWIAGKIGGVTYAE